MVSVESSAAAWGVSFDAPARIITRTLRERDNLALQQYIWPGNVRELENAVERAMVVAQEPELRESDFTLKTKSATVPEPGGPRSLEEIERAHILRVLDDCGGHQTRAAEVLGIDRVTLHHKLKKYGWNRKEKELVASSN